jgi:uncharacterized membrane protein YidH (DUF202 family)
MPEPEINPNDLMAVERSATALFGLAISLIVLGFVVEKFELFLHIIGVSGHYEDVPSSGLLLFYNYLGITIVAAGILLAGYAYRYYVVWVRHLETKHYQTDKNIYFILSIFISAVGLTILLSMVLF